MMGINRRQFTLLLGCGLVSPNLLAKAQPLLFASAAQTSPEGYALKVISKQGRSLINHQLPARAHHVAKHPHQPFLAAVGRRPETFIDVINYETGLLSKRIESSPGQHFYGHAIYSNDGRWLITTENEIQSGQGLIVIRDCGNDYRVIKQFSSYGIGPHELKLTADGKTLVVANGGILTTPGQGREKLNLDSMQPSLTYIDLQSGRLTEQIFMPAQLHQLSIRHFDINDKGRVVIALQYQGAKSDDVPLIAFHSSGDKNLSLVKAPAAINLAMKQYCGSARFDHSGTTAAVSSPRGDLVTFWNAQDGSFLTTLKSRDGCGLAATHVPDEFLISTGRGHCYRFNVKTGLKEKLTLRPSSRTAWDNHLTLL